MYAAGKRWLTKRHDPYTEVGIRRLKCIRCGDTAMFQWQICSDGNNYRPLCGRCDVALNALVLEWMRHPQAEALVEAYARRQLTRPPAPS